MFDDHNFCETCSRDLEEVKLPYKELPFVIRWVLSFNGQKKLVNTATGKSFLYSVKRCKSGKWLWHDYLVHFEIN